jgi:radical SAM superfamily enzyme
VAALKENQNISKAQEKYLNVIDQFKKKLPSNMIYNRTLTKPTMSINVCPDWAKTL